MTTPIEIVEVGPRDGLQSEPETLPTTTKLELIRRLADTGLKRIEVASFVNPKRVPQMADAEAVMAGLPRREAVQYVGLVLNRRGLDRAIAAGCTEIGMVLAATDSFAERNQGMTKQQALDSWLEIAPVARAAGLRAQVTISVSFGCPFEGEVDPRRVVDLAMRAAEAEPLEIAVADTIGVAVPTQVDDLVKRLNRAMPKIPIRCHFHNTRNTGIANAYAAAQAGVRILDSSIAGIGGCPFAPNATGNIATDDLVYLLNRAGFSTGVNLNGLIETSRWLGTVIGRSTPSMVARAGGFPKAG